MVLDWVNSTVVSPVVFGWDVDVGEDCWLHLGNVGWGSVSEHHLVFIVGHGGHEVVSNGEGVLWVGVDDFVLGILGHEDVLSEVEFFGSSEVESVFSNVLEEEW